MKKTLKALIYASTFIAGLSCLCTSCDYLDQKPENLKDEEQVWSTRADAESYLYNIYGYIWKNTDDQVHLGMADETSCSLSGVAIKSIIQGNWGPSTNCDVAGYWNTCFRAIRQSLIFEENIDRVPENIISTELKNQYKAESRFLRGWFYWNLLRLWGPVPLFDSPAAMDADFNAYTRRPFDECVEYICDLMESTLDYLPVTWPVAANIGRPTQGSALAVISQVRLLAASELWNGNSRFNDFKNKDGEQLASTIYDPEKWKIAADAAKRVIDLNVHHLYKNNEDGGDATFDPFLSFRDTFLESENPEILFGTYIYEDYWLWAHDERCNPKPGGYAETNATQNVVDAFLTRNGLDINDDPEYTEEGFAQQDDPANYGKGVRGGLNQGYRAGESNMYVNRDPRFYASVHYNARPVISATTSDARDRFSSEGNQDGIGRAEYYYSGLSGASQNLPDFTGYNVAKMVSPESNTINDSPTGFRPYIHIRYAEILLNYMEAMNEYDPNDRYIVTYFNLLRERAGIPGIAETYPTAIGNKEEMRKWILRERQTELAFEGDRYFTLCRRLLFEKEENRKIYRMNVMANDNGQGFLFEDFYQRNELETRYWDNKMYLYPISQSEIDRARGLVQNPGW